jgi:uracil-DNA glycosylase family 4
VDDAREQLRRYLEQRRERGERELVLDTLSAEEALRIIGGGTRDERVAERAARATNEPQADRPSRPVQAPRAEPETPPAERVMPTAESADWREVLRPASSRPVAPTAGIPPSTPEVGGEIAPAGIVIGGTSRELFTATGPSLDTLADVAASIATCTRCPLYTTAKNPVPGEGNPDADLLVVGEAPGATEDETGRPFVGQAGQLLTKILGAINLAREDVFICNVLKHRPPANRNPRPEEVTACSPYLVRQIELTRPKVILALGTFAAQTLLDTKLSIGKLRGQIHRYYGVPLIVTYHPAALLRNPAWKRPAWEDVQLARRVLDSAVPGA